MILYYSGSKLVRELHPETTILAHVAKHVLRNTISMFGWNFSSLGLETVFSFPLSDKNKK